MRHARVAAPLAAPRRPARDLQRLEPLRSGPLRNLPEIGVWAAQVLHEHLQKHQQIGFRATKTKEERDNEEPQPVVAPDVEWMRAEGAASVQEPEVSDDLRTRLTGSVILVQGTRTGAVFFRPADPKDSLMRRALKHIRKEDPGSFRPSLKHHIWTTDQERFPRVIGRLEGRRARAALRGDGVGGHGPAV